MNRLKKSAGAFLGLLALIALTPATGQGQTGAQNRPPQDVTVINTTSNPIPAQIVGMPAVTIDTSANTVRLDNAADNPVHVRVVGAPEREPFQIELGSSQTGRSFKVPAGKRLVIEYASARAIVRAQNNGCVPEMEIWTQLAGKNATHFFPVTQTNVPTQSGGVKAYSFSQQTRLYAGPDTTVTLFVSVEPIFCESDEPKLRGSISGYLEDAP